MTIKYLYLGNRANADSRLRQLHRDGSHLDVQPREIAAITEGPRALRGLPWAPRVLGADHGSAGLDVENYRAVMEEVEMLRLTRGTYDPETDPEMAERRKRRLAADEAEADPEEGENLLETIRRLQAEAQEGRRLQEITRALDMNFSVEHSQGEPPTVTLRLGPGRNHLNVTPEGAVVLTRQTPNLGKEQPGRA